MAVSCEMHNEGPEPYAVGMRCFMGFANEECQAVASSTLVES